LTDGAPGDGTGKVHFEVSAMERALRSLVQKATRDLPEIVSLAVGDRQGLPIICASRGASIPALTLTGMATMALHAANTVAEALGFKATEHLVAHTDSGELVILSIGERGACLMGVLRSGANLGFALVVLRRLSEEIRKLLEE